MMDHYTGTHACIATQVGGGSLRCDYILATPVSLFHQASKAGGAAEQSGSIYVNTIMIPALFEKAQAPGWK